MAKYNDVDDTEVEEEKFRFMSTQIDAQHWMNLGGNLGISGVQLSQIQGNNPFNVMEQVFQMLLRWKQANGRAATYTFLYTALDKSDLVGLKHKLQAMRQENQRRVPGRDPSPPNSPPKFPENSTNEAKKTIFISFSLKSLERVTKLKDRIEKDIGKDSCWICTEDIGAGDALYGKITQALEDADIILCMMDKYYINSKACEEEALLCFAKGKRIIPILLEQMDWNNLKKENGEASAMQLRLNPLLYINMFDQTKEKDEFKKLKKAIEESIGKS